MRNDRRKTCKDYSFNGRSCIEIFKSRFDGVPDRLVLLPKGRIAFVEMKAPGKMLRPLQVRRKRQLEALGFSVYCIDGVEQIGGILSEIQSS